MNVTIIGAGQSGRGFLGRLAFLSGASITFIDRDNEVIDGLKKRNEYLISFFGNKRIPVRIHGYSVYHTDDPQAISSIKSADLVITCVLAENVISTVELFKRALDGVHSLAPILVCENGINPSVPLRNALPTSTEISEAVLLCTTCSNGIDIISQDLDYLPYDASAMKTLLPIEGFCPESRFDVLCRRKIYTYNCLSANICYLGAEKGYESFESAATDLEVFMETSHMRELLDRVIAREYNVPIKEQNAFSQAALDKFTNMQLCDTVKRNARGVIRKLSRAERIVAPMLMAKTQGEDITPFERLIVAAIRYGIREGTIIADFSDACVTEAFLKETCGIEDDEILREISSRLKGGL